MNAPIIESLKRRDPDDRDILIARTANAALRNPDDSWAIGSIAVAVYRNVKFPDPSRFAADLQEIIAESNRRFTCAPWPE